MVGVWGMCPNLVGHLLRILKLRTLVIEVEGLDHLGFWGEWDSRRVACGISDRMV